MSVKERLREFIDHLRISDRAFCRSIGVSSTFISSMRNSMQPDKLHSIAVHYPELSTSWLMTGVGSMLVDNSVNPDFIEGSKDAARVKWELEFANSKNEELQKENKKLIEEIAILRYRLGGVAGLGGEGSLSGTG